MTAPPRLLAASMAAVATAAALLAGCADTVDEPVPTAALETVPTADVDAAHNAADVAFAQAMLAMHQQEAELSAMALERSEDRGVRALASDAAAATADDDRLVALLTAWGAALPGGMEGAPEVDPSTSAAPAPVDGLVGAEQMADLRGATGEGFDALLLDVLAGLHQDGVDLASAELDAGSNPQALELAAALREEHAAALARVEELRGR